MNNNFPRLNPQYQFSKLSLDVREWEWAIISLKKIIFVPNANQNFAKQWRESEKQLSINQLDNLKSFAIMTSFLVLIILTSSRNLIFASWSYFQFAKLNFWIIFSVDCMCEKSWRWKEHKWAMRHDNLI